MVQRFAWELRQLREKAGSPTYRQLALRAHYSQATLAKAASGRDLPSLAVTLAYVRACGGDTEQWGARWREAAAEAAPAALEDITAAQQQADAPAPYLGLAAFTPEDADRFFGREQLVAELVATLDQHRFLAVFGASGSGKSSLLQAGLLPAVREEYATALITPGAEPESQLRQALGARPAETDVLLVVDQFEELFTLCPDLATRERFITGLLEAVREPGSRTRVVLGVRADFYAHCAQHRGLVEALRKAQVLVGPMTTDELRAVITGPAIRFGYSVEGALVSRLIGDATGQPGVLPLLSHALLETWRRRRGNALTLAGYEAAGGIHRAITRTDERSRLFAEQLRRTRLAAGLSLSELARRVHYSKAHLSNIEAGRKPAGVGLARRCDAAFGAEGRLSALVAPPITVSSGSSDGRDEAWSKEVWTMNLESNGSTWFTPVRRRDALASGAALPALRLTERGASAAANQETTLTALQAMFEQHRLIGQMMSPATVLPALIAQTHTLRGLARVARSPVRERFLRLAARYAEYTGWMAQEAGNDRGAMWWTQTAVDMAGAVGDHDVSAHSLVRRALVALYRDDAAVTVELARRAQTDPRAPVRVRGMAALREAQGHALAREDKLCQDSLDRAARLLETVRPDPSDGMMLGPAAGSAVAPVVNGWCLYDLGRPAEAAEVLDRELARLPSSSRRSNARFGARRALAHAAAGEIDHACALTHQVLDSAELVDSATIRLDLRRLARTLARWASHRPVSELQPRLTMALHAPVS
ncbi:transcriptional regulator with XRE-family HTH domain [Kibdelosporangium banguiense]|uniref:Transcriptional regulator with XRE-family HTH domain n=1 Tax=Kibdelosporangium banguiense TaxID=1365924 RepID=A0ABS4TYW5_9PSEU|nr:transcriptional regulator with XRE-family HTH domain [Kibdelosporangium banguiense]